MAADCTLKLVSFFGRAEAGNPKAIVAGITEMLMCYPAYVAHLACHPVQGLPARHKWMPTIAEVKVFCDEMVRNRYAERRRAEAINHQLDERKRLPAPDEFPERREAVVARIQSMHGPRWGITQDRAVAECHESPEETCMRVLGIDAEAFAKIPDRNGHVSGVQLSDEALAKVRGEAA